MGDLVILDNHRPQRDCLNCVFCAVSFKGTYCLAFNEELLTNEAKDCEEYQDGRTKSRPTTAT